MWADIFPWSLNELFQRRKIWGEVSSPHSSVMYKNSCPVSRINAAFKALHSAALIWSSSVHLQPSLLLIHAPPKHVVSPDRRERMVQFNYLGWLVSALVGNYMTELQETAPLHPIRAGTEGAASSRCPTVLHSSSSSPYSSLFLLPCALTTSGKRLWDETVTSHLWLKVVMLRTQKEADGTKNSF